MQIVNLTPEPALNVSFAYAGTNGMIFETRVTEFPFKPNESRTADAYMTVSGTNAEVLLTELASGSNLELDIVVRHQSLRGVVWESKVTLRLRCDDTPARARLEKAARNEEEISGTLGAVGNENDVFLTVEPKPSSWQHSRA